MIASATYLRDIRATLLALFKQYFDGAAHTFGGAPIVFPLCNMTFDRPQAGAPMAYPMIYVEPLLGRPIHRKANPCGIAQIQEQPMRALVFTSDPDKIWDVNDQICDLLAVVLNGNSSVLDAAGMKLVRVQPSLHIFLDASQEYQVSQRLFILKTKLQFGAAGTGTGSGNITGGIN